MSILDVAVEAARASVPPKGDTSRETFWRWMMFTLIWTAILSMVIHISLACGWLPQVYPGFAKADKVEALSQQLNSTAQASTVKQLSDKIDIIVLQSLETSIRSKIKSRCTTKDDEFRAELSQEIEKLQRDYRRISGEEYHQPACSEL